MHIPNAKSEQRDVDDAAISHLLTLAREYSTQSGSEFARLARSLADLCESDPNLKTLGEQAQLMMGNGALLQGIFRRLFPAQTYPFAVAHLDAKPNLTEREHQVLLELARGRPREQLARRLSIKPGTVKRHIENIYRKLGVESSAEAIAKATALGLADFDLVDIVLPFVDGKNLDLTHFSGMMLGERLFEAPDPHVHSARALASSGLLLVLLSTALTHDEIFQNEPHRSSKQTGIICHFSPTGEFMSRFDCDEILHVPYSIALAPLSAKNHGFAPGMLYILNGQSKPDPLNPHAILECTPQGNVLRSFTGGAYLSTRLNAFDIAFTSDGRLLAASGSRTDAILEFTNGGDRVRRLIDIVPYGGIATDDSGQIYVAGGRWYRNPVHVYDADGELLRKVGQSQWAHGENAPYQGVAVDGLGRVYVANAKTACMEVYNADGIREGTIQNRAGDAPWRLALDDCGLLYSISGRIENVWCDPKSCASQIDVLDAQIGALVGRITAAEDVRFISLCAGPSGTLFAGGLPV